jgi:hypothetical protein
MKRRKAIPLFIREDSCQFVSIRVPHFPRPLCPESRCDPFESRFSFGKSGAFWGSMSVGMGHFRAWVDEKRRVWARIREGWRESAEKVGHFGADWGILSEAVER